MQSKCLKSIVLCVLGAAYVFFAELAVGYEQSVTPNLQKAYQQYALEITPKHMKSTIMPKEFLEWMQDALYLVELYIRNASDTDDVLDEFENSSTLESISQCRELICECERRLRNTTIQNTCCNCDARLDFAAAIRNFDAATKKYNSIAIDISWRSSGVSSLIVRTKRSVEKACLQHILLDRIANMTNSINDPSVSVILTPIFQNLAVSLEEEQWDSVDASASTILMPLPKKLTISLDKNTLDA
ncbi:MAG: hypothetical protein LBD81_01375 [Holosporaceae bacterium]|jgi:hypothetical protein|nr:hypothetical protein [Holosporaceae bacterium]